MEARQIIDRAKQALRLNAERWQLLRFWRWWTGELKSFVPHGVLEWNLRRRRLDTAFFEGTQLVVRSQSMAGWTERARIELAEQDAAEQATLLRNGLAAAYAGQSVPVPLALILGPAQCLRRTLRLPQAVEENLHAALAFEMDRYTPFRAEQVYFDCVVSARDYEARQIEVVLAVAARPVVDGARARLESAGAEIVAVRPAPGEDSRLNLLPQSGRTGYRLRLQWPVVLAAGFVAALFCIAVALPIVQKRGQVIALNPVVAKAYEQALIADSLQRRLDTTVADYNYLIDKKRSNPTALQILDEASRLLPDDTWVQQFELKTDSKTPNKPRQVQLQGESGSSGKMIGLIENAKFLTQASWRSPITSGQPGAGEHFDLLAVVKRIPPEDQKASFAPPGAAIPSLAPAVPAAAPPVAAAEPNAAAPAPPQTAIRPPPAGPPGFREPEVVDAGALLGRPKK